MMKRNLLLVFGFTFAVSISSYHVGQLRGRQLNTEGVSCRLVHLEIEYADNDNSDDDHEYLCETTADEESDGQGDLLYTVDLPGSILEEPSIADGDTMIAIPKGHIVRTATTEEDRIVYPSDDDEAAVTIMPQTETRRRRLTTDRHQGNHNVLVVHVSALDAELSFSPEVASERIFGLGPNGQDLNLVSQFSACSFGKLQLSPAQGDGITNGVGQITLQQNIVRENIFGVLNQMMIATEESFGRRGENWDFVIYCVPSGPLLRGRGYLAFGIFNDYRSVYNNEHCINFSNLMHELGHNLGLRHSGEGGRPYQDVTGLMGYSDPRVGAPASCFNAYKNYFLGWYEDRTEHFDPFQSRGWSGFISAFVDYDKTSSEETVLMHIGSQFYLQYNRAKDFNRQTRERANEVVIIYQESADSDSELLGSVAADKPGVIDTLYIIDFEESGYDLVIQACEHTYGQVDRVGMSIYLDDGVQSSTCGLTPMPTTTPVSTPSPAPTVHEKCEDDKDGSFLGRDGETVTCLELSRNHRLQGEYCVEDQPAFTVCKDTCGKCHDGCTDAPPRETFLVNNKMGHQNCVWLSVRPQWQELLCKEDHPANTMCGETCNSCEDNHEATMVPSMQQREEECDDSKDENAFRVDELNGNRSCAWLANSPAWQPRLCVAEHTASSACPETCGVCTDSCEDDSDASFFVNNVQGSKSCEWLSVRPGWQTHLCRPDHEAYTLCRETCDTCA